MKCSFLVGVNEHTPAFTSGSYSNTIDENLSLESSILQVAATDQDDGVDGKYPITEHKI